MSVLKKPDCRVPRVWKCILLRSSAMLVFAGLYKELNYLWKAAEQKVSVSQFV